MQRERLQLYCQTQFCQKERRQRSQYNPSRNLNEIDLILERGYTFIALCTTKLCITKFVRLCKLRMESRKLETTGKNAKLCFALESY